MSQRMPPVQYIMTGVSAGSPANAAGTAAPVTSVGVSRKASCVLNPDMTVLASLSAGQHAAIAT